MKDQAERVREFLDMIAATREARRARALGEARDETAAILRRARAEARARMRAAVIECRARAARDLASARAELGTLRRQLEQEAHRAALAEGMGELERTLSRRWKEPRLRRAWIDALVGDALAVLPVASWRIEHPPDFEPRELAEVRGSLGADVQIAAAADVVAGLRIFAKAVLLDGTIRGLLARRADVEGRLLAEVEAAMEEAR